MTIVTKLCSLDCATLLPEHSKKLDIHLESSGSQGEI
jgi:hypothetical protein